MTRDTATTARRSPWGIWLVMVAGLIAATTLSVINSGSIGGYVVIAICMMLGYGTIGALLASRVPGNPLGWLMLTIGVGYMISGVTEEWVTYGSAHPGSPGVSVAAWITNWSIVAVLAPIPTILLLFPTGTLLSRRWRIVVWTIAIASASFVLAQIVAPGSVDTEVPGIANPTGVDALGRASDVVGLLAAGALLVAALASVAAVFLRYHRSAAAEREQVRWPAYVAGTAVAMVVVSVATASTTPRVSDVLFYSFFATFGIGLPVAIGYAILRHRLYDIDLVIKKTVTYTLIAVALIGLYLLVLALATLGVVSRQLLGLVLLAVTVRPIMRTARSIADRVVYGHRATPYEVLSQFSERMSETYSIDDVLPRMATVLQGATGADRADVWLLVAGAFRSRATSPGDADVVPAVTTTDGQLPLLPGSFVAEVRHQGQLLGALTVSMPPNDRLNSSRERLVQDLAAQAGPVLGNVRLIEELRASRQRMVHAQDEGRRRLERNIHDGAQQQLVALSVKTRLADSMVGRDPAKAREVLAQIQADTNDALETLRDLARGIYPPLLADKGLRTALEAQARKAAIPVKVDATGVERYPAEAEATVYFCVLEALNNVAKYAGAATTMIQLAQRNGSLTFTVTDDGRGFDRTTTGYGTGLQGMADRLDAVGGALTIESTEGSGTTVSGTVPVT